MLAGSDFFGKAAEQKTGTRASTRVPRRLFDGWFHMTSLERKLPYGYTEFCFNRISPTKTQMETFTERIRGYRFGAFEMDLRAGEIRKNGMRVRLQNQPFRVLAMLLEHSPDVVLREELRKELWNGDTFVDFDHSLSIAMNKIREALGDSAENARFIETLPRRGYRFVASVDKVLAPQPPPSRASHGASVEIPLARSNGGNGHSNKTFASSEEGERGETNVSEVPESKILAEAAENVSSVWRSKKRFLLYGALSCAAIVGGYFGASMKKPPEKRALPYVQITNFTDSAFAPAVSPDGRQLVFLRGTHASIGAAKAQVYTKLLPDGEPHQLTRDDQVKCCLAFSPDSSKISYTVTDPDRWGSDTVTVSAFGGEPEMFLRNAAALSWIDNHHILFSEFKTGLHMGIVTATDTRAEPRDVYLPQHERAMARRSHASPDGRFVLVVESDRKPKHLPCRVVPLDGRDEGRQVGPIGECTSAAWSPDGAWMYFSVTIDGFSQIWRQRFPEGKPEQITFGAAEAESVAVWPDGRSLLASMGMRQSILLIREAQGERTVSTEGDASFPRFSEDGRRIYYKLRRQSKGAENELWTTDLSSGKSVCVLPGFSIEKYDVSGDGREVVFADKQPGSESRIWLASTDRLTPPVQLASDGDDSPLFGPDGTLLFRRSENGKNYVFRMNRDGSALTKAFPNPIIKLVNLSPGGKWVKAMVPLKGTASTAEVAISTKGGEVKQLCPGICIATWSLDGKSLYFSILDNNKEYRDKAVEIPVQPGELPPNLPPTGFHSMREALGQTGARLVDIPSTANTLVPQFVPGPEAGSFAYIKTTNHRNLYRIPLE
jgi:DNA-binding winged helix-turn-helix (wHTH) protein/Tol biopolymer transport system component